MRSGDAVDAFWAACTERGVVSKKLTLHRTPHAAAPVGLCVNENVKNGAPLINVPYNAVMNGQTLRGDVLPRALPPLQKTLRFLTRRGRMGAVTAHSLWLAAFLACRSLEASPTATAQPSPLAPFLSAAVYPPLPFLLSPANAVHCPPLRHLPAAELAEAARRIEGEVELTHVLLRHHARRRGVPAGLCPRRDAVDAAYRTVMQRAVLLPWSCVPSAPGDLAELLAAAPETPLVPSLVPVIDLIRAAPPAEAAAGEESEERSAGNCALLTCVQSDFLSPSTRRRIIVETAPLAAHRVVVCATRALKAGDELLMEFE